MRLKIAVQKSGRLTDSSLDLLTRCGLKFSRGKDQLMCYGENMPLDVLFVRDDDIPDLVQEDVCDLGLVGLNVVEEKRLAFAARGIAPLFEQVQLLDFGRCRLCIAVPDGFDYRGANSLSGKRIATTYPNILNRFLSERGIRAEVVVLSGAVEIAPRLGRADLICDLVSTGSTLAANHLRQAETVLESQAALIRTPVPIPAEKQEWTRRLLMRIDGVEQVKGSKYIMLHAPRSALAEIAKLLPGKRGADGDSARRPRRPCRGACGLPRKRLLGNPRRAQKSRSEFGARAARRENAGLIDANSRLEIIVRIRATRRSAAPRAARRAADHCGCAQNHRGRAQQGRRGAARVYRRIRRRTHRCVRRRRSLSSPLPSAVFRAPSMRQSKRR